MSGTTRLRPLVFTAFDSLPDCASFDSTDARDVIFRSNCHVPLDGAVTFRQVLTAEALSTPDLQQGIEVEIAQKAYTWLSLEMHIPMALLAGQRSALISAVVRAETPDVISLGYGGELDRGRGFECFVFADRKIGRHYKVISTALDFSALPMDEIASDRFVVALYFNNTGENTLTFADFRVDLTGYAARP